MTSLQSQQQEKWQKERTEAISEMFDNVREDGIYPTSKFFERIDAAWDATWKAAQEGMWKIECSRHSNPIGHCFQCYEEDIETQKKQAARAAEEDTLRRVREAMLKVGRMYKGDGLSGKRGDFYEFAMDDLYMELAALEELSERKV